MQAVFVVMPVFILIAIGWFLRQKNWISPQTVKENYFLLYWFAIPCTLLNGILKADISVVKDVPFIVAIWLPYALTLIAVWMMTRGRESNDRLASIMLCATRSNNFFAGLPIVTLAMGQRGTEAGTLILALSLPVVQIFSICGAQLALFGSVTRKTVRSTCIQLLRNPIFVTCVISLSCVAAGLHSLPRWLDVTVSMLSDISTGLALVMLGTELSMRGFLKKAISVWRVTLFKLVLFPAVTYAVYICFGMPLDIIQAGVLLSAMPIAVNGVMIAQEMGMDTDYCAMGITITALVSLLTLPVLIQLLGLV